MHHPIIYALRDMSIVLEAARKFHQKQSELNSNPQNQPTMEMTPLKIEILLHYHYSTEDFQDSPAAQTAINEFVKLGILQRQLMSSKIKPVREALDLYIKELLAVKLPTQKWVIEEEQKMTAKSILHHSFENPPIELL